MIESANSMENNVLSIMIKPLKHVALGLCLTTALINLTGCIAPAVLVVAGAGIVGANTLGSNVPISTQAADVRIRSEAISSLRAFPELQYNSNISVTVFNRIVLILGQVPTEGLKNAVAQKIAQIEGVNIVYNELTVGPKVSLSTFADDAWITSKVKTALTGVVNPLNFKVVTENGVVYLLAITTEKEGQQAALKAATISGVRTVVKAYFYQKTSGEVDKPVA